jgi:hypothetical protein
MELTPPRICCQAGECIQEAVETAVQSTIVEGEDAEGDPK